MSIVWKVLVHGSAEATEHLKQHCLKSICPHVYAPQIEETIDVTSDLCAFKVNAFALFTCAINFGILGFTIFPHHFSNRFNCQRN